MLAILPREALIVPSYPYPPLALPPAAGWWEGLVWWEGKEEGREGLGWWEGKEEGREGLGWWKGKELGKGKGREGKGMNESRREG